MVKTFKVTCTQHIQGTLQIERNIEAPSQEEAERIFNSLYEDDKDIDKELKEQLLNPYNFNWDNQEIKIEEV